MQSILNVSKKLAGIFGVAAMASCQSPPFGYSQALSPNQRQLVMDVDTGRDDAWAIISAARSCRLSAVVASYGNAPLASTQQNSRDVLALGEQVSGCPEKQIPVWGGERQPLPSAPGVSLNEIARRARINGNGLCNLVLTVSREGLANHSDRWALEMRDYIERQGKIDYVVTGPMTNLARLIDAFGFDAQGRPKIVDHIDKVVVMGGSFDPKLAVDFNFLADPEAAQKAITTFGRKLILVPFDETRKLHLTMDEINALQPEDKASVFSRDLMLAYARKWSADHTVLLHDPSTLLALETGADLHLDKIKIILTGENAGKTIKAPDGTEVEHFVIPQGYEREVRDHLLGDYLRLKPASPSP